MPRRRRMMPGGCELPPLRYGGNVFPMKSLVPHSVQLLSLAFAIGLPAAPTIKPLFDKRFDIDALIFSELLLSFEVIIVLSLEGIVTLLNPYILNISSTTSASLVTSALYAGIDMPRFDSVILSIFISNDVIISLIISLSIFFLSFLYPS